MPGNAVVSVKPHSFAAVKDAFLRLWVSEQFVQTDTTQWITYKSQNYGKGFDDND